MRLTTRFILLSALLSFPQHGLAQATEAELVALSAREDVVSGDTPIVDAAQELRLDAEAGRLGVLFYFGPWQGGPSVDRIIDGYVTAFSSLGVEVAYRVVISDEPGLTLMYIVGETAQGWFSPIDAYDMVPDIAAQHRFVHGL